MLGGSVSLVCPWISVSLVGLLGGYTTTRAVIQRLSAAVSDTVCQPPLVDCDLAPSLPLSHSDHRRHPHPPALSGQSLAAPVAPWPKRGPAFKPGLVLIGWAPLALGMPGGLSAGLRALLIGRAWRGGAMEVCDSGLGFCLVANRMGRKSQETQNRQCRSPSIRVAPYGFIFSQPSSSKLHLLFNFWRSLPCRRYLSALSAWSRSGSLG